MGVIEATIYYENSLVNALIAENQFVDYRKAIQEALFARFKHEFEHNSNFNIATNFYFYINTSTGVWFVGALILRKEFDGFYCGYLACHDTNWLVYSSRSLFGVAERFAQDVLTQKVEDMRKQLDDRMYGVPDNTAYVCKIKLDVAPGVVYPLGVTNN